VLSEPDEALRQNVVNQFTSSHPVSSLTPSRDGPQCVQTEELDEPDKKSEGETPYGQEGEAFG
jgi:hypothetical protein